jgi:hypothetical protein
MGLLIGGIVIFFMLLAYILGIATVVSSMRRNPEMWIRFIEDEITHEPE